MFGIGMPELVVILVIALIVLGPTRLPEVAKVIGRALAEFRKATSDLTEELSDARRMLEDEVRAAERQAREEAVRPPQVAPAGAPKTSDEPPGS